MKLVVREDETVALADWLRDHPIRIASILGKVELLRAARRVATVTNDEAVFRRASAVIASVALVGLSDAVADRAAVVGPAMLRSLDAVHLATAILAGPLEAFVAYDDRLVEAARTVGLGVMQPGRDAAT